MLPELFGNGKYILREDDNVEICARANDALPVRLFVVFWADKEVYNARIYRRWGTSLNKCATLLGDPLCGEKHATFGPYGVLLFAYRGQLVIC